MVYLLDSRGSGTKYDRGDWRESRLSAREARKFYFTYFFQAWSALLACLILQFNYPFPFFTVSFFHHQQEWRFDTRAESIGSGNHATKLNSFQVKNLGGGLSHPPPIPLPVPPPLLDSELGSLLCHGYIHYTLRPLPKYAAIWLQNRVPFPPFAICHPEVNEVILKWTCLDKGLYYFRISCPYIIPRGQPTSQFYENKAEMAAHAQPQTT